MWKLRHNNPARRMFMTAMLEAAAVAAPIRPKRGASTNISGTFTPTAAAVMPRFTDVRPDISSTTPEGPVELPIIALNETMTRAVSPTRYPRPNNPMKNGEKVAKASAHGHAIAMHHQVATR